MQNSHHHKNATIRCEYGVDKAIHTRVEPGCQGVPTQVRVEVHTREDPGCLGPPTWVIGWENTREEPGYWGVGTWGIKGRIGGSSVLEELGERGQPGEQFCSGEGGREGFEEEEAFLFRSV